MRTTRALVASKAAGRRRARMSRTCRARPDPRRFGRSAERQIAAPGEEPWGLSDDMRLFAMTFGGGFLFVSILIA